MIIEILLACFSLLGISLIAAVVVVSLVRVNGEADRSHKELMREFDEILDRDGEGECLNERV